MHRPPSQWACEGVALVGRMASLVALFQLLAFGVVPHKRRGGGAQAAYQEEVVARARSG